MLCIVTGNMLEGVHLQTTLSTTTKTTTTRLTTAKTTTTQSTTSNTTTIKVTTTNAPTTVPSTSAFMTHVKNATLRLLGKKPRLKIKGMNDFISTISKNK